MMDLVNIEICVGSSCHLKGAYNVISEFQRIVEERELKDSVTIKAAFCLGHCTKPVSVRLDGDEVYSVNENNVESFFDQYVAGRVSN